MLTGTKYYHRGHIRAEILQRHTAALRWLAFFLLAAALAAPCYGQSAPVWKTGQTIRYYSGDDGALERGVAWPEPRFTNPDGTDPVSGDVVLDQLTGLVWARNADIAEGTVTWQQALAAITDMNSGIGTYGYTDWRLPNRKELRSLMAYSQYNPALPLEHPFTSVQAAGYWSSTTNAVNTSYAWAVDLYYGYLNYYGKSTANYVLAVRSGRGGTSGTLSLSGTVTNSRTGEPAQGITVSMVPSEGIPGTSDANGYFTITGLAGGSYTVSAGKTGFYAPQTHSATVPSETPDDFTIAPDVIITGVSLSKTEAHAGETIQITYTLTNSGTSAGTVWLDAVHRLHGTGVWEYDAQKNTSGHDLEATVPVGTGQTVTRYYTFPESDSEGSYDMLFSLWEDKDGTTGLLQRRLDLLEYQNSLTLLSGSTALDCTGAVELSFDRPYTGATTGGASNCSTYSCESWNESGPEVVHTITTAVTGTITAAVADSSDLDVFILSACNPNQCLAGHWSQAQYAQAPPGTYYIVVDGYEGASGTYTLQVYFESQTPLYSLSGAVVNRQTGEAVANATVSMSPSAAGPVLTSADGSYTLSSVPEGSYTVTAAKAGWYKPQSMDLVVSADAADRDFELTPSVVIAGIAPASQTPVPGETIELVYTLNNTGDTEATVWLGAAHRQHGTGVWEYDADKNLSGHDLEVTVPVGTGQQFSRYYTIPDNTTDGTYDILASLWEDKDIQAELLQGLLSRVESDSAFSITGAGSLHHFEFSEIAATWENTPFSVTITAKDILNATVADFNGILLLSCEGQTICPTRINMENGAVTFNLKVLYPCQDVALQCRYGEITGTSNTFTVAASAAPVTAIARFEAWPLTGPAPLQVAFTDNSSGEITSRLWNFGDNTTSTEENPVHIYTQESRYTVTLTVSTSDGQDVFSQPSYIAVYGASDATTTTTIITTTVITATTTSTAPQTATSTGGGGGGSSGSGSVPATTTTTARPTTTTTLPVTTTTTTIVLPPPELRIISQPVTAATFGRLYLYDVEVSVTQDEAEISYALKEAPRGMTVSASGVIAWTPRIWQTGTHTVVLGVTANEKDGTLGSVDQQFSIRVTSAAQCPATLLLGNNEQELSLLRQFRDRRLTRSAAGLVLAGLYYLHGNETTKILSADPELFMRARQCVRELLPAIADYTDSDKKIALTALQQQNVTRVLQALRAEASPALRMSLAYVLKEMERNFSGAQ